VFNRSLAHCSLSSREFWLLRVQEHTLNFMNKSCSAKPSQGQPVLKAKARNQYHYTPRFSSRSFLRVSLLFLHSCSPRRNLRLSPPSSYVYFYDIVSDSVVFSPPKRSVYVFLSPYCLFFHSLVWIFPQQFYRRLDYPQAILTFTSISFRFSILLPQFWGSVFVARGSA